MPAAVVVVDEAAAVWQKRYDEARAAGMSHRDADRFAEALEVDVGALRRLVMLGCPPGRLAAILL